MARFRASCYFDITCDHEDTAKTIAQMVANFLGGPDFYLPPEGFYNPYIGGVAEIKGDPIGDAKRLEKI